jgi:signal transduction histidine kinase
MTLGAELRGPEITKIFPFHFTLDRELTIVAHGPALCRIVPGIQVGSAFEACFAVSRPKLQASFESFARSASSLFLIEVRANAGLILKGQIVECANDLLLFLGSPWITSLGRLRELGLALKDFALHDPVSDYLVLLQAQRTSLDDASRIATQLQASNHTLQAACTRLEEEVALRERTELELRHAQRLNSLGQLASGAAHEFNNLLTPMLCLTEGIRDELPAGASRDDLDAVVEACHRAAKLVANILTFGRGAEVPRGRVELWPLVAGAARLLRATIPTTIELRSTASANLALVVDGEPTQLHQILLNLASNARHAIGDALGTITIGLATVELDGGTAASGQALVAGTYARLTVTDTGCGIAEPALERVFEPFFTTKRVGEGTGLGLSIVHGIVASHGGRIQVESAIGHGTTFTIDLPTSDAPALPVTTEGARSSWPGC